MFPEESVSATTSLVLIASSSIKIQSKGDDQGSGLIHWLHLYCTVTPLRG